MRRLWILPLIVIIIGSSSYVAYLSIPIRKLVIPLISTATPTVTSTPVPCNIQAREYMDQLAIIINDWLAVFDLASSTSRIALSPVVSKMQDIKARVRDLNVPPCAEKTRQLLMQSMDATIIACLAFMQDQPQNQIDFRFKQGADLMNKLHEEYNLLKDGAPPYD